MLDKAIKGVLVGVMVFSFASIASAETWTVDSNGAGTCSAGGMDFNCTAIQDAIDEATAGDIINVIAGTYNENIVVDKSLTINGANAGTSGSDGRSAESIIDGQGATTVTISANDVMLDGFTVQGGGGSSDGSGIIIGASNSGVTIRNNIITDNQIGLYANCDDDCLVERNLFLDNNRSGAAGGAGIYTDMGSNGMTIDSNEFTGHLNNSAVIFAATSPTTNSDLEFTNNNIHDNNNSNSMVYVLSLDGAVFSGNTISGGSNALNFASANSNIEVSDNILTGNGRGVKIVDDGYGFGDNSNIVITDNNLSDNSIAGVEIESGFVGTLDATLNFWGPLGPTHADNPSGTGSAALGDVNFTPWYSDEARTVTTDGVTTETTLDADSDTTSSDEGDISVEIPANTTVVGPAGWDGIVNLPTVVVTPVQPSVDAQFDEATALVSIEVGSPDTELTFDKGVRLLFAGQAGNYVGWSRNGAFTPITAVCTDDSQITGDALGAGADCKIDSGDDLVVWTKHFTVFTTYTQTRVSSGGGSVVRPVAAATPAAAAPTTPAGEVLGAETGASVGFSRNLTVGSRGADVTELHRVLIAGGYLRISAPTGYFGPLTLAAVKKYQAANGIPATGFVGPRTLAALNGQGGQVAGATAPAVTAEQIANITALLQGYGVDAATITKIKASLGY